MSLTGECWLGLVILILALFVAWVGLMGRQFLVTAPVAFLLYQAPNVLGVLIESSRDEIFRADWPILVSSAYLMFVVGGLIANSLTGFSPSSEIPTWRNGCLEEDEGATTVRWIFVWCMVALSLTVGLMFYRSVGYNSLLGQLRAVVEGTGVNYEQFASQRKGVLSEGYRAAGYTVQFVAIILPTLAVYIWLEAKLRRSTLMRVVAAGLIIASIFFVTIQGGRTYILAAILMLVLISSRFTSPLPEALRLSRSTSLLLVFGFILAFGGVTALQGRGESDAGELGATRAAVVDLWERVGGDYSRTQMIALAELEPEVPVYGTQWWSQLKIILPGPPDEGMPFDVRVYEIIYGNTNGNNPLDPWGSYYYNFGIAGLVMVPLVFGFVAQVITINGLVRARRNAATVVIMSAMGYRFMFFIDLYSLFLTGPFTLWFLNWLMQRLTPAPSGSLEQPRSRKVNSRQRSQVRRY